MKKIVSLAFCLFVLFASAGAQSWIRVNQVGYLPEDKKVAVLISLDAVKGDFTVRDAKTGEAVYSGKGIKSDASKWALNTAYRLDFSSVKNEGGYYIEAAGVKSAAFKISAHAYDGTADFMLKYLRHQRCGDNPENEALCHQHDGYIVDHPTKSGQHIDVTGGWHDATDYLQYLTTSATACYHLLFAYDQAKDKSVFKDEYDATGRKGANGIPDIVDEAKWGLDWVNKMNPAPKEMYYQIADDRDHAGFRMPYKDSVDYGWGKGTGRCVYFVTGKPQGLGKYINRTTGVSSAAGKFASTFALGAKVMKQYYPEFAAEIEAKVVPAFDFAEEFPGNTQTACLVSPYFYEEDSYVDDIELAAATIYNSGNDAYWLKKANYWGDLEPISPGMFPTFWPNCQNYYHHYQWYPFINLGHYYLATADDEEIAKKYQDFMRQGLQCLKDNAGADPFMHGVPYIWCSSNLTSAAVTQANLYRRATGDEQFLEMETALRDWLLGCNPWGTTMIVGLPEANVPGYDTPVDPHCSYNSLGVRLPVGGLVDGPIYNVLFQERAGSSLTKPDTFADFNKGIAVYHDDIGDYSSNEPTMDGAAGLCYYFAQMAEDGAAQQKEKVEKDAFGAIVRLNPDSKTVRFVFSADENFVGGEYILNALKKAGVKASFFMTGNALRKAEFKPLIERILKEGHYLGGHSDNHVLYADWGADRPSLMSADSIITDLQKNYAELAKFGVKASDAQWYLPPYEHYNAESVSLLETLGLKVFNYTPGTATPADYTTPDMKNYKSSKVLLDALYKFEAQNGLGGSFILLHPGIVESRTDRLYYHLEEIIKNLKKKGYNFDRL